MRKSSSLLAAGFCALGIAASASAQERQPVTFEVVHTPAGSAYDVYLLGDLPELGANDLTRSVKLISDDRSTWRLTVSLPTNRTYTYQYYERFRFPADPSNGIPFGEAITDQTNASTLRPYGKFIYAQSTIRMPVLQWRQQEGDFASLPMRDVGPGRVTGERRWEAGPFGETRRPVEFFVTGASGAQRDPADGTVYQTPLDALLLQDGGLFDYVPTAHVSAPRRDYEVTPLGRSSVTFHSAILGADYDVRVMLPRGYDQHRFRRYPVIYIGDGLFAWDALDGWDAFSPGSNCFDPDASVSTELTQFGAMGEVVQVAVDNIAQECPYAELRLRDFVPPGDNFDVGAIYSLCPRTGTGTGQADRFAAFLRDELKPWIDAKYRTVSDREHTAFSGYGVGGLFAIYLGWDFPDTFGRVGSQSLGLGANFLARVRAEPKRPVRVYIDAGGAVEDYQSYQVSLGLRDSLLTKTPEPYVLEGDLRHFVGGLDQHHTWAAGGSRWREMLPFLFPATEEPPACYDGIDNDGDGAIDYAPGAGGDDGCASALDPSEGRNECSDGIDNDADGLIDMADPGCPFPYATIENPECDDGIDNDQNGSADFADSKCQPSWPYWETPPACGLGVEMALVIPLLGLAASRRRRAHWSDPASQPCGRSWLAGQRGRKA